MFEFGPFWRRFDTDACWRTGVSYEYILTQIFECLTRVVNILYLIINYAVSIVNKTESIAGFGVSNSVYNEFVYTSFLFQNATF